MSSNDSVPTEKKIGNVKWFNNKAGFGFITMGENTDSPKDVFAHYSNINVKNSQYKYLVQGEYVEFDLTPTSEGEHEVQATSITGIQGGATLCERRRISRETAEASLDEDAPIRERRQRPQTDSRPQPPRLARSTSSSGPTRRPREDDDSAGFTTVRRQSSRR
jgi:cold shock CspA family protein